MNTSPSQLERQAEAAEILDLLLKDQSAREMFQQCFGPGGDAIDALTSFVHSPTPGTPEALQSDSEIRQLERIIHARPVGDGAAQAVTEATEQLEDILRGRVALDARVVSAIDQFKLRRRVQEAESPTSDIGSKIPISEPPRNSSRPRPMALVAIAMAVIAVAAAAGWALSRPIDAADPAPTSASTPVPSVVEPVIWVPVGKDLLEDPSAADALQIYVAPDKLIAATALGERGGWTARGFLSDAPTVCMYVNDSSGGTGRCVEYGEFVDIGLTIDQGSWSVHWDHDGTVTWDGI